MRFSTALPWLALSAVLGYMTWQEFSPADGTGDQPSLPREYALPAGTPASGPVSYAPAVARAAPAVVNIYTTQTVREAANPLFEHPWFRFQAPPVPRERSASSLGSGVIVSADGYILTNDHVVADAERIEVALHDGREVPARLIGRDPDSDLALLRIELDQLPVVPFKTTANAVGDVVLAIGNPFGVGQTVTQGIISALGRSGLGINTYEDFVQTDAAINPGNSGGALVDVQGNLVGINTAIYSRSGGSMGIGFAIPAPVARQVMDSLIANGHVVRGWLGVEISTAMQVNGEEPRAENAPVVVAGVLPGGPGDRAGLRTGDQLLQVGDVKVDSPDQVIRHIGSLPPGSHTRITVLRGGDRLTLKVTMGTRPKPVAARK